MQTSQIVRKEKCNAFTSQMALLETGCHRGSHYYDTGSLHFQPDPTFANSGSYFYANSDYYYNSHTRAYAYFYTHAVERAIDFNCATGDECVCGGNR